MDLRVLLDGVVQDDDYLEDHRRLALWTIRLGQHGRNTGRNGHRKEEDGRASMERAGVDVSVGVWERSIITFMDDRLSSLVRVLIEFPRNGLLLSPFPVIYLRWIAH